MPNSCTHMATVGVKGLMATKLTKFCRRCAISFNTQLGGRITNEKMEKSSNDIIRHFIWPFSKASAETWGKEKSPMRLLSINILQINHLHWLHILWACLKDITSLLFFTLHRYIPEGIQKLRKLQKCIIIIIIIFITDTSSNGEMGTLSMSLKSCITCSEYLLTSNLPLHIDWSLLRRASNVDSYKTWYQLSHHQHCHAHQLANYSALD